LGVQAKKNDITTGNIPHWISRRITEDNIKVNVHDNSSIELNLTAQKYPAAAGDDDDNNHLVSQRK
jgi:hypothetical protein